MRAFLKHRFLVPPPETATNDQSATAMIAPDLSLDAILAKDRDIGVYYSGLGAVTPLATVRTRVDGQLMSVRYREGDTVHKGDLLAEIDDGPYQGWTTGHRATDRLLSSENPESTERIPIDFVDLILAEAR